MKPSLDRLPDVLTSAKYAWLVRLGLAVIVGLVGLMPVLMYSAPVRADSVAQPAFQEGYPGPGEETDIFPTDDSGYPGPGEPDITLPPFIDPDETQTEPTDLIEPTEEIGSTLTLAPDRLATENAEMGDSQVTPPGSETPAPSITPYVTGTQTVLPSAVSPASTKGGGGLNINWGLFWIGFSIPVLIACGGILYLLDRRPNLFRRR